jgi:hypothetical protein
MLHPWDLRRAVADISVDQSDKWSIRGWSLQDLRLSRLRLLCTPHVAFHDNGEDYFGDISPVDSKLSFKRAALRVVWPIFIRRKKPPS